MDGAHSIERCEEVTDTVLQSVFDHLFAARISLEGMVLKPNMVVAGKKCGEKSSPEQVAEATVRTLKRHVPAAVPGIAFLSGGQSPVEATLHLSLMNAAGPLPWALTFSYGRALQDDALQRLGRNARGFRGRPEGAVHPRQAERSGGGRRIPGLHGKRRGIAVRTRMRCAPARRAMQRARRTIESARSHRRDPQPELLRERAAHFRRSRHGHGARAASRPSWGRAARARPPCCG